MAQGGRGHEVSFDKQTITFDKQAGSSQSKLPEAGIFWSKQLDESVPISLNPGPKIMVLSPPTF